MIEFILQYKWLFLIVGEVIFWVSLIGFFLLRYLFSLEKLSIYFIFLWLFSDVWLLALGVFDYKHTGTFDTFQVIIVIFLIYALTFGRSDLKKLDLFIQRTVKRWRGEPLQEKEQQEKRFGMAFALQQDKEFVLHLIMYVIVIAIFSFFVEIRDIADLFLAPNVGDLIKHLIENGLFDHPLLSKVTGVWTLILLIDAVITASYFVSPRKEGK